MMKRYLSILLMSFCVSVNAELTIEITQGIASSIPISVVPFKFDGSSKDNVDEIVRGDLERSGHF